MKAFLWTSSVALLAALGLTLGASRDYGKEISATDAGAVTGGQTTCPGYSYTSQYFACPAATVLCTGGPMYCASQGYYSLTYSGPGTEYAGTGTLVSCNVCGTACSWISIATRSYPACQVQSGTQSPQ